MRHKAQRRSESGHAIVEVALMAPWIFFIFMAVVDIGFYCYAAINVQNAARAVAMYASASSTYDATRACNYALGEIRTLPIPGGTATSCGSVGNNTIQVTIQQPAAVSPDGQAAASVTVTVQTLPMIPIPGLAGQFTIARTAVMRVKS